VGNFQCLGVGGIGTAVQCGKFQRLYILSVSSMYYYYYYYCYYYNYNYYYYYYY
jgi:hypothetical protein